VKNTKKTILAFVCAVLIIATSVVGTMAYLTDTDSAVNTFTVGTVGLSLDEAKVEPYGTPVEGADRVKDNEYLLIPDHTYIKDPTIHVDEDSENAYIFVKVDNQIASYEAKTENTEKGYKSIADQIAANGWTLLEGVADVYYKEYIKGQEDKDLEIFEEFKIDAMANDAEGWDKISPETTKINVTGYAVQKDGFGTAKAAWNAADFPEDDDAVVVTNANEFDAAWRAGGTVKLGKNVTFQHLSDPNVTLPDIVLDLNGYKLNVFDKIYSNQSTSISAYRKMTIMDSKGGGSIAGNAINAYNNNVTITGGTYNIALTGNSSYTITGGTFNGTLSMSSATITGGKFRSDPTRFVNVDTHTVTNSEGWYTVTAN